MTVGELKEAIARLQYPSAPGGPVSDNAPVYIEEFEEVVELRQVATSFSSDANRRLILV